MKRGKRLFFAGERRGWFCGGSAALRKDKGIFCFWIFEKRYFFGCARGLILKKRKQGAYWNREKGMREEMGCVGAKEGEEWEEVRSVE